MTSHQTYNTIADLASWLKEVDCHLSRMRQQVRQTGKEIHEKTQRPAVLTELQIAHLETLNQRLRELQQFMESFAEDLRPVLHAKLKDPENRLCDFDLHATIRYILREDEPGFDPNDDNFLAKRRRSMKENIQSAEPGAAGPGESFSESDLFRDLQRETDDLEEQSMSLEDMARIGEVWIDMKVIYEAALDVETGQWKLAEDHPASG